MFRKIIRVSAAKGFSFSQPRNYATKSIGTHNGLFHCDEALAVYLLRQTKEFKEAQLVRSRDPNLLSKCDVLVDVGGEFDPDRLRFDHHQTGFSESFIGGDIKLSSAGLIYKYFGKEIINNILNQSLNQNDSEGLDLIYKKLYNVFVRPIDAIDNGIPSASGGILYVDCTGITHRVRRLNPQWYEKKSEALELERFEKASALVGQEFHQHLDEIITSWIPSRQLVQKAFQNRFKHHKSGKIIVLETYCPWTDHLSAIDTNNVFYAIYPATEHDWRVQCVKKRGSVFESRHPLPRRWRGLPTERLRQITNLETAMFVHASGFIGGCNNYSDAIKMAEMALKTA
ncbi:hypothetical protein G6F37_011255 [Rhizopus arrhizus]|nr:hypothetical protein G6F38_012730 [Rhizopus arrhizus]KAG1150211.1 hypothetical protein G6F37_011255 [Rhizopus arrhizus]